MPTVPFEVAIPHLVRLGYSGIELAVTPQHCTAIDHLDAASRLHIARLLREHRLALPALAAHSTLLEDDRDQHARIAGRLRAACDLAAELTQSPAGPPAVVTTLGGTPAQWRTSRDRLAERVAELADHAAAGGVTIALEPHVGEAVDTPTRALELLELVGRPNAKLNFDISHYEVGGVRMEESIPALVGHAVHAHVKDQRGEVPDYEFLVPGEGDFDYVRYLRSMAQHGYAGFVTVETSVMVQRRPGYVWRDNQDENRATIRMRIDVAARPRVA